jgi:hypothetical protein
MLVAGDAMTKEIATESDFVFVESVFPWWWYLKISEVDKRGIANAARPVSIPVVCCETARAYILSRITAA